MTALSCPIGVAVTACLILLPMANFVDRLVYAASLDSLTVLTGDQVKAGVPVIESEYSGGVVAVNVHCSLLTTYQLNMDGSRTQFLANTAVAPRMCGLAGIMQTTDCECASKDRGRTYTCVQHHCAYISRGGCCVDEKPMPRN
jgi:hypothetical protein